MPYRNKPPTWSYYPVHPRLLPAPPEPAPAKVVYHTLRGQPSLQRPVPLNVNNYPSPLITGGTS